MHIRLKEIKWKSVLALLVGLKKCDNISLVMLNSAKMCALIVGKVGTECVVNCCIYSLRLYAQGVYFFFDF
jgi:hypothetical protein